MMDAQRLFEQAEKERNEEKLDQAVADYLQAREGLKVEDSLKAAEALHMVGVIYYQQQKYDLSKQVLNSAKEDFEKIGEMDLIGATLRDLGICAAGQKDYQKAKSYFEQSIKALENSSKTGHLGISQVKLGNIFLNLKQADKAKELILKGISNIEKSDDKFFLSTAYYDLAKLEKSLGEVQKAKLAAEKSLQILMQISAPDEHQKRKEEVKGFILELD